MKDGMSNPAKKVRLDRCLRTIRRGQTFPARLVFGWNGMVMMNHSLTKVVPDSDG